MADQVPTIDEIDSSEKLEAYLRTRPVEEAQVIAHRAAMRKYPGAIAAVEPLFSASDLKGIQLSLLRIFRAAFVGWQLLRYPEHPNEVAAIQSSFDSNEKFSASIGLANISLGVSHVLKAAIASIRRSASASNSSSEQFWLEVQADCNFLTQNLAKDLVLTSVWRSGSQPITAWTTWIHAEKTLQKLGEHWLVVRQWFDVACNFGTVWWDLGQQKVPLSYAALLDDEFWSRDPDIVMKEISEWLNSGATESVVVNDATIGQVTDQLVQTPADFRFSSHDNQPIDAVPFRDAASNREFAETTLIEVIEKALEFRERLEQVNADPRIKRSVDRLLAVLPQQFDALNPALMRSKTRSLEAIALAYASAGAEAELFPDAVAELLDLVGTLKDLQGSFPQIADVERNTVAIEIAGREQEVEAALSAITVSARELSANYPGMITATAMDAVAILDDDIVDAPNQDVKRNLLAGSALIKHNFLSAVYRRALSAAGREALRIGKRHYDNIVDKSVAGVGMAVEKAPVAFVAYYLGGPMAATAVFLPDLFRVLAQAKELIEVVKTKQENEPGPE
ncbi:hypothetical protein GOZ94_01905 [Agrobacterium vitis]|uniref:hypothetical protein n=1 Tax=Agrobacterium vitis TaxID=373 RepID=UPI0012E840F3|nr:hypothetical protein [Agrobacterium vitis]MVA17700.1 hypothetical protein [Agrobacterium vitis]